MAKIVKYHWPPRLSKIEACHFFSPPCLEVIIVDNLGKGTHACQYNGGGNNTAVWFIGPVSNDKRIEYINEHERCPCDHQSLAQGSHFKVSNDFTPKIYLVYFIMINRIRTQFNKAWMYTYDNRPREFFVPFFLKANVLSLFKACYDSVFLDQRKLRLRTKGVGSHQNQDPKNY